MVIWVRGRFGLIMLMFLCTWRPQGRCSSHSYILLQDIFCHLRSLFHGKVWLSGVLCEWMSFPSYCRFGVCNYLETIGGLLPRNTFSTGPICSHLSMWHLKTHSQPSSPPSCVKPGESMKNCSSALVLCGAGLLWVFFYLSELLVVDATLSSKCFQRNVFFWLFCQLLGNMCPSLFPNWPLYLPPLTDFDCFSLFCHWQVRISHLWAVWLLAC